MRPLPTPTSNLRAARPSARTRAEPLGTFAAILAMAAMLGAGCERPDQVAVRSAGPPPVVVESVRVVYEDVRDEVEFVGQLDSAHSVVLKPEMSGIVASVEFEEGAPVKRGDPLVRLRDGEQRALLREAQAIVTLAHNDFQRARSLAERNAESDSALERAESQYEIARARFDLAKIQLDRTVIRAPFDGVVGARLVSLGERVSPGGERGPNGGSEASGLVRIDSLDQMELIFTIPETVMALARIGMPIAFHVAPYPDETFKGEVTFVDPRVNATSRRVLVKARVPNPEHKLRPGLFAKLSAEVSRHPKALMVPEGAVVYGRDGTFVWRIVDDQPERVPVELGIRQPGRVELRSGVRSGDRVVSAGTHKVRPGGALRDVASHDANSESSGS